MEKRKAIIAGLVATGFLAVSVTSAPAREFRGHGYYGRGHGHYGPGPVLGLLGAVVVGAATIATAPFVLLADAAGARDEYGPPPPPPPRGAYYGRPYYGPQPYGPPPYGPPPGYYGYYGR